jgi:hypothetical protein
MNDDPFRDKVPEWLKEMQGRVDDAEARAIEATLGAAAQIQTLTAQRNRAQAMADHRKLETAITKARLKAGVEKEVAELRLRAERSEAGECISCGDGLCSHPAGSRRRLRLFPSPMWGCQECGQHKGVFGPWTDPPGEDMWGFEYDDEYSGPKEAPPCVADPYQTYKAMVDEPTSSQAAAPPLHVWGYDGDFCVAQDTGQLELVLQGEGLLDARAEQWVRIQEEYKLTLTRGGVAVTLPCSKWAAITQPGRLFDNDEEG